MELYAHINPQLKEIEHSMISKLESEDKRIYGMLVPFMKRGGKRFRPALCLLSCGANGGKYKDVLEAASIIELFHNFTLIHDDIEDDSRFRRGEPTLHVAYGIPMALNTGDALYTLLLRSLIELPLPQDRCRTLQSLYIGSFKRVVDGQGIEIDWIRTGRFDVKEDEYLSMISGKTSALMGLSCEIGALLSGKGEKEMAPMRDFGEKIGMAFQIHDDILNVTGDFEKYQKEIGGDISEGKRTLMVVHCLSRATAAEKSRLKSILASHTKEEASIREAIDLFSKYGSIDFARALAKKLVEDAKASISFLPPSKDKDALIRVADYCIRRDK